MKKFFLVMALGFVFATGFGLTVASLTQQGSDGFELQHLRLLT